MSSVKTFFWRFYQAAFYSLTSLSLMPRDWLGSKIESQPSPLKYPFKIISAISYGRVLLMGGNSIHTWHENGTRDNVWGLCEKRVDMISQNPFSTKTNEGFLSYKYGSKKTLQKWRFPNAPCMDCLPQLGEKLATWTRAKIVYIMIFPSHGASGAEMASAHGRWHHDVSA